jgi:hypothetical protein
MYFTPDGRHAIVVEEARQTLAFRDPHTFALQKALPVQCLGIDHMDFSADGTFALASCEFSGQATKRNRAAAHLPCVGPLDWVTAFAPRSGAR